MESFSRRIHLFLFISTQLCIQACFGVPAAPVFLNRSEANQMLQLRYRRANSFLEELKRGNVERECTEEKCSYEEAREIFSMPEQLDEFWKKYTEVDQCQTGPCANGATCVSQGSTYICICAPKYQGRNCDKETLPQTFYGCLYKNGGCEHFCTEEPDSVRQCHCATGYSLAANNKSCVSQDLFRSSVPFPCGKPVTTSPGPRIVKGQVCPKGQCPWQALLKLRGVVKCGGVILNYAWILTAAHCVWQANLLELQVTVGEHILTVSEGTEQHRRVSKIIIHPLYNSTSYDVDIALLHLRRNISLGPFVIPICLPPAQGTFVRTLGAVRTSVVSGWGRLSQHGAQSNLLQRLEVPRVSLEKCKAHSGLSLTNNMLCAGFKEGGRDACRGDSGGPLVTCYNNTWFLTGIVSWGKGCARADMYGIYTRVSVFVEWITSTMAAK
ncbi:coagulation factor VII isoform X1 [Silurus meridionalis]|uniref:coagulation factor VII isoform X1 n=1 Tax=Silurus meridionalis TaxID=175797 RepID=UPI001EEBBBC0|nr:coagulation factor VII isoform X1 [Silurus meridionalis]